MKGLLHHVSFHVDRSGHNPVAGDDHHRQRLPLFASAICPQGHAVVVAHLANAGTAFGNILEQGRIFFLVCRFKIGGLLGLLPHSGLAGQAVVQKDLQLLPAFIRLRYEPGHHGFGSLQPRSRKI